MEKFKDLIKIKNIKTNEYLKITIHHEMFEDTKILKQTNFHQNDLIQH